MKTLNEFRRTNQINITGMEVQMIARITDFLKSRKEDLIGLASINLHNYVVRVNTVKGDLADYHIRTDMGSLPEIVETDIIFKKSF